MVSKSDEVLAALAGGPVPFRKLVNGRSAAFRLAYARLLHQGLIVEHGMGTKHDPKYVGLPGATFPDRRYGVRPADVALLVRAGLTKEQARAQLKAASQRGMDSVLALLEEAHGHILRRGTGLTFTATVALQREKAAKNRAVLRAAQKLMNEDGTLTVEVYGGFERGRKVKEASH